MPTSRSSLGVAVGDADERPAIPSLTLGAHTDRAMLPGVRRQRCVSTSTYSTAAPVQPCGWHRCPTHSRCPLVQYLAQQWIDRADPIANHTARWHAGIEVGGERLDGQGRFRGELVVGNTAAITTLRVLAPALGKYGRPSISVWPAGRVCQIHGSLGILDPADGASVLALHPPPCRYPS
jgi:hypothetical protein